MALLSVADALARVIEGVDAAARRTACRSPRPKAACSPRISRALRTQPPQDVSAMDGYAVRAADVAIAPATLTLIGEVAAGRPFTGRIEPGETARIFTGGVLPAGTDTVVIQENTSREGDAIVVEHPAPRGRNVRVAGLDFRQGRCRPAQRPPPHRPRRRACRRDEPPDRSGRAAGRRSPSWRPATNWCRPAPSPARARSSIPTSSRSPPSRGAKAPRCSTSASCPDRLDETIAGVRRARDAGADVLLTAGGASVGDYDLVQPALAAEGLALSFWKVAVRPGKPLLSGRLGAMRVLGLPGNPVSAYVCAVLFLTPLIRTLLGRQDVDLSLTRGVLGRDLKANDERADYLRATLELRARTERAVATPFPVQDSSMLVPLAAADCLVVREPHAPAAAAGSPCVFVKLQD